MSAYLLRRSGYMGGARAGAEQAFAAALLLLRPGSPPRKVERHLGFPRAARCATWRFCVPARPHGICAVGYRDEMWADTWRMRVWDSPTLRDVRDFLDARQVTRVALRVQGEVVG